MNWKAIAERLQLALGVCAVGHTHAMLYGAEGSLADVVAHNQQYATRLARDRGFSLEEVGACRLFGRRRPVAIDHAALSMLLGGLLGEIAKDEARLEFVGGRLLARDPNFARFVLQRGGTGDAGDVRAFIDHQADLRTETPLGRAVHQARGGDAPPKMQTGFA